MSHHTRQAKYFYPRSPCGERLIVTNGWSGSCNFYPRSPCGERLPQPVLYRGHGRNFYPRSPCGERPAVALPSVTCWKFLSTLSLRRATTPAAGRGNTPPDFYPRSPCGERRQQGRESSGKMVFLSTLSLRRATRQRWRCHQPSAISIHALLAESDCQRPRRASGCTNFYPRSPCGERLSGCKIAKNGITISIHALLAESDGACIVAGPVLYYFYLRSPCGERRRLRQRHPQLLAISIHALLAESDPAGWRASLPLVYFYPRSPCGERREIDAVRLTGLDFYPRSPCGERPTPPRKAVTTREFLSTLSLRRATTTPGTNGMALADFYPRSPCGERHRERSA